MNWEDSIARSRHGTRRGRDSRLQVLRPDGRCIVAFRMGSAMRNCLAAFLMLGHIKFHAGKVVPGTWDGAWWA
jgi:hypothetical protein